MVDLNSLQDRVDALQQQAIKAQRRFIVTTFLGLAIILLLVFQVVQHGISRSSSDLKEMFWLLSHDGATQQERVEAFLALVEEGNTEWRVARLEGLDLRDLELPAADLTEAVLDNCNLSGANLRGAILVRVGLEAAELGGAQLQGSTMRETWLLRASLVNANLSGANMVGALLQQVSAAGADFTNARMAETDLLLADLSGANLTNADLTGANMEAALLEGANLSGADFSGCGLLETDFANTNWWRAVGLSVDLVAELRERYPPGESAAAEWREDFSKWAKEYDAANPPLPEPAAGEDTDLPADVEKPADK